MATTIEEFGYTDCNKINASCVNAYTEISLAEDNPAELVLDTSWGTSTLDLTPAVKAGETKTYLKLSPSENPTYLEYIGEDGVPQCISGDDLSRIIKMTKLADVDQDNAIADGDVYMYDADSGLFKPFDLQEFVDNTNQSITNLGNRLTNLETAISNLTNVVNELVEKLTPPNGAPDDVKVAFGNINLYSDNSNSNLKTSGLYTHDLSTTIVNDEYFA